MSNLKVCPFCAEDIKKAAIVCKHCKRDLPIISEKIEGMTEEILWKDATSEEKEAMRRAVKKHSSGVKISNSQTGRNSGGKPFTTNTLIFIIIGLILFWYVFLRETNKTSPSSVSNPIVSSNSDSTNEISPNSAINFVGKRKTVCGVVNDVYYDSGSEDASGYIFIHMNGLTAFIRPGTFKDLDTQFLQYRLPDNWACISGLIFLFRGEPQIEIIQGAIFDVEYLGN
jgi:hypothetical protein